MTMKVEVPVVVKPFGSHCHERVFLAMEMLGAATKDQIAECASTTVAVVSNAIHDFKRGLYTKDNKRMNVPKERVGKAWEYELEANDQLELF